MLYVSGDRSLGIEIALSWTESLGPRPMIRNHGNTQNKASDLQLCRAAYRNRTDDLRITRGTHRGCACASCTDGTGNRTGGIRGAGIIRRPGPRTGPRPTPLRAGHLATVRHFTECYPRPQVDPAVMGVTVLQVLGTRIPPPRTADVHDYRNSGACAFVHRRIPWHVVPTPQSERRDLPNRGEARRLRMTRRYEQLVTD